jgi:chromosome segregation ATPase
LIIIISLEHIVLIVKVLLHSFIGEKPLWVSKVEVKVLHQLEEMNIEEKKIEQKKQIKELQRVLDRQKNSFDKIMTDVETIFAQMKQRLEKVEDEKNVLMKNKTDAQTDVNKIQKEIDDLKRSSLKISSSSNKDVVAYKEEPPSLYKRLQLKVPAS